MGNPADNPDVGKQPASSRPSWVRWRIVFILMGFSFLAHFNRTSMSAAADLRIMRQFSISETAMGTVYSAFLLFYMLGMTPGGLFVDRFGAWTALLLMGLGSAVFCMLTGLVGVLVVGSAWATFLVIRSLMGLFNAPVYPGAGRVVAHWMPSSQRAWANGLILSAAPVGTALTYVLMGGLIDAVDWPLAFVITGTATGMVALAWMLYGRDRPEQHPAVNRDELALIQAGTPEQRPVVDHRPAPATGGGRTLLANRGVVLLTLCYMTTGYFEYLFFYWMHYYFKDVLQLGEKLSRYYAGIPPLAMAIGMPLGGWLSDRLCDRWGPRAGRALVAAGGMVAGAGFLFLGVLAGEPAWIVFWFSLALGAMGCYEAAAWTAALEIGGRRGGTSAGIINTGGNLGGMISPIVTPWVGGLRGWQWGIGLGGAICLLGVVCWLGIDPRPPAEDGPEAQEEKA